jgi:hypothetical protein
MVKIFIDTEFTDFVDIDLISIGMVDENGREFYAERNDFEMKLCNPFVHEIVLPQLKKNHHQVMSYTVLSKSLQEWIGFYSKSGCLLCYDSYVDYVLFAEAFAQKIPFNLRHNNIFTKLNMDVFENYFVENNVLQHHALNDARANKKAFEHWRGS